MSTRDTPFQRVVFWAALLTGAVLVGMQFSCNRTPTVLAAPGFPHASRRVAVVQETTPPSDRPVAAESAVPEVPVVALIVPKPAPKILPVPVT